MKKCIFCGALLEEDAIFCSYCGKKIDSYTCPYCGTEVEDDSVFCSKCGMRLQAIPEEGVSKLAHPLFIFIYSHHWSEAHFMPPFL